MRVLIRLAAASLCLALLAACGGSDDAATPGSDSAALASLPATLEGHLTTGIEEIDDGSDISGMDVYGTLQVGEDFHNVKIAVPIVRSLDLPSDGARVRVTVSSKVEEHGDSHYVITAAQKI